MESTWLPRFACPECHEALRDEGGCVFTCDRCGHRFERRDEAYRFLTPRQAEESAPFLRQYQLVRDREGRRQAGPERRKALPDVAPGDPHAAEWRLRRQSYAHLLRHALPAPARRPLHILDLGAGNGWLSHRLATFGHAVVALDKLDDEVDGLGACRDYPVRFAVVQADFDCLPFEPSQFDLAIFDGSLHYAPDPLASLAEAKRVLAPGGALTVVDSPMFVEEQDGRQMVDETARRLQSEHGFSTVVRPGVGFLTFDLLDRAANALGVRGRFVPSPGPLLWRARRQMARLRLGRAPAAFGVWVAQ